MITNQIWWNSLHNTYLGNILLEYQEGVMGSGRVRVLWMVVANFPNNNKFPIIEIQTLCNLRMASSPHKDISMKRSFSLFNCWFVQMRVYIDRVEINLIGMNKHKIKMNCALIIVTIYIFILCEKKQIKDKWILTNISVFRGKLQWKNTIISHTYCTMEASTVPGFSL